jgi:hypothetical protein
MKVSDQPHAPAALPPEKEPPKPTGLEFESVPETVCTLWNREESHVRVGIEPQVSNSYPVTIPTELSRLLYPQVCINYPSSSLLIFEVTSSRWNWTFTVDFEIMSRKMFFCHLGYCSDWLEHFWTKQYHCGNHLCSTLSRLFLPWRLIPQAATQCWHILMLLWVRLIEVVLLYATGLSTCTIQFLCKGEQLNEVRKIESSHPDNTCCSGGKLYWPWYISGRDKHISVSVINLLRREAYVNNI